MKVLIVDDAPANLKLLRAVLEADNFAVVEAADGQQALASLERGGVDAIISDILMPRMDGYRLCQEVRKDPRWKALPFIFHTATYTSPSDEKLCYDLGGDKYLPKPAPNKALLAALREVLHGAAKRPSQRLSSLSESDVMQEYSERLVSKLEEKNQELALRTEQLEQAKAELQQANRELESRVQQRTAELEASNQELESFSYSVSHDLRAPLRHIDGFIDILLQKCAGQLDESDRQLLQNVSVSAQKMRELIDVLLELTRVTHGELHRSPVDLSALAGEVMAELQAGAPDRVVEVSLAPGLTSHGDRRLLRIVLMNLLGNAWKFTSKRAAARVQFGRMEQEAQAPYFVRDNGAGFDMAYANKLFGVFERLHRRDEFEGTGIGLATVQRIIRRHNGKTWAEGAVDQGATFYFTLDEDETKIR
jgi:signal transduction histidine kinase